MVQKPNPTVLFLENDINTSNEIIKAASKIVGEEKIVLFSKPKVSSEDFAFYSNEKPGCFFRYGSRNEKKGFVNMPHNNDFDFDEEALVTGAKVFLQFIMDKVEELRVEEK